jgi:nitroreductase
MQDFLSLAAARYSVRSFKAEPVAQAHIDSILAAGHLAPTGCNYQPQRIFVFRSEEAIAKLRKCTRCHFGAPTAMLVCYHSDECWVRKYDAQPSGWADASIVTTHMMLQAASVGVGSTWVMHFDPAAIRREFELDEKLVPVALLVMGYPSEDAKPLALHDTFRKMEDVVSYL